MDTPKSPQWMEQSLFIEYTEHQLEQAQQAETPLEQSLELANMVNKRLEETRAEPPLTDEQIARYSGVANAILSIGNKVAKKPEREKSYRKKPLPSHRQHR